MRTTRRSSLCALVVGIAAQSCVPREVTRVYDGRARVERFIDEHAYREYLHGAELEARGDVEGAALAYAAALEADPESIESLVALASLECAQGADPSTRLAEAERLDPAFAPLWTARAGCARRAGKVDLASSERAFTLDPKSEVALEEWVAALESSGHTQAAWALVREQAATRASSLQAWVRVRAGARSVGDAAWGWAADRSLRTLERRLGRRDDAARRVALAPIGELAALAVEDDAAVRRWSRERGLSAAEEGAVFLVIGRASVAVGDLRRALEVEPRALDVRLVASLAAVLSGDRALASTLFPAGTLGPRENLGVIGQAALAALAALSSPKAHSETASAFGQPPWADPTGLNGSSSLGVVLARCLVEPCLASPSAR